MDHAPGAAPSDRTAREVLARRSLTAQTGTTGASDFDFIATDSVGADGGEDRAVLSLQLPVRIGPGGGSVHLRCFQFQIGVTPVQLTATSIRLAAVAVR